MITLPSLDYNYGLLKYLWLRYSKLKPKLSNFKFSNFYKSDNFLINIRNCFLFFASIFRCPIYAAFKETSHIEYLQICKGQVFKRENHVYTSQSNKVNISILSGQHGRFMIEYKGTIQCIPVFCYKAIIYYGDILSLYIRENEKKNVAYFYFNFTNLFFFN